MFDLRSSLPSWIWCEVDMKIHGCSDGLPEARSHLEEQCEQKIIPKVNGAMYSVDSMWFRTICKIEHSHPGIGRRWPSFASNCLSKPG